MWNAFETEAAYRREQLRQDWRSSGSRHWWSIRRSPAAVKTTRAVRAQAQPAGQPRPA